MIPDWALTFISSGAGAFVAAWFGAYVGFRRGKKERALDRRIGWHESAIQSLAQYEEQLKRLSGYFQNVLITQGRQEILASGDPNKKVDFPTHIRAPEVLWNDLREAECRARSALQVSDLYAEGRAQVECEMALSNSVNVVSGQWLDVSAEPMIPWNQLSLKASASANLRHSLQESFKLILELDGILARTLGPKYRKWKKIRIIKREIAENARKSELIKQQKSDSNTASDTNQPAKQEDKKLRAS
ncbi:MAG: hypothetical protein ACD_23C00110G0003 [uncultured bacterium]|nr:MAG: hypothetical protein ACD_23C00110G0003 [uncultured bacterium]